MSKVVDRLVTPVFRIWFPPNFLSPREMRNPKPGQEAKFGLTAVWTPATFDSQEKMLWEAVVKLCNDVAFNKFKKTLADFPDSYKKPFHSGRTKPEYEMTDGMIYSNMTSKFMPQVAGRDGKTIEKPLPETLYAGCYARASTNAYAYQNEGSGVALGLYNIMFVKDGPRLSFRVKPEEDFSAYAQASSQAPLTDSDLGL